jgi:5-(carboxyamino)imidazole ribonucleotide synthase
MHQKTIGILGGGQLGKMLIEAGYPMSISYHVLESGNDFPCKSVLVGTHIDGNLYQEEAMLELDEISDVLTYEIEHLDIDVLAKCTSQVIPGVEVLQIIQDKGLQKDFLVQNHIATLPYKKTSSAELLDAVKDWPQKHLVIKSRRGGYDGQGVWVVEKEGFIQNFKPENWENPHGFILEMFLSGVMELSVLVAVDQRGNIDHYQVSEMVFDAEANLMDYLISPANISEMKAEEAIQLARKAVSALHSPGLFAVELFAVKDGDLFVNEIAPRPHNSGHHTIESCITSQYAQLNRILMGWPLGSTQQKGVALTCNILGPRNVNGAYTVRGLNEVLNISGVFVHLYNKSTTKPFRKLGHFTIVANTRAEAIENMEKVRKLLFVV